MYSEITDYLTLEDFAKNYVTQKGKRGVTRVYIYQLRDKEIADPGSTGLDFLRIGNSYFVRYSAKVKKGVRKK